MLNFYGEEVTKPIGFKHEPQVEYSVVPVQPIPYALWGECLRAELKAIHTNRRSGVKDIELVIKRDLKC